MLSPKTEPVEGKGRVIFKFGLAVGMALTFQAAMTKVAEGATQKLTERQEQVKKVNTIFRDEVIPLLYKKIYPEGYKLLSRTKEGNTQEFIEKYIFPDKLLIYLESQPLSQHMCKHFLMTYPLAHSYTCKPIESLRRDEQGKKMKVYLLLPSKQSTGPLKAHEVALVKAVNVYIGLAHQTKDKVIKGEPVLD